MQGSDGPGLAAVGADHRRGQLPRLIARHARCTPACSLRSPRRSWSGSISTARSGATRCGRSAAMPAPPLRRHARRPRARSRRHALGRACRPRRRWRGGRPEGQSDARSVARLRLHRHRGRDAGAAPTRSAWLPPRFSSPAMFVGADSMSRTAGVPSYIADVDGGTVAADHADGRTVHPLPAAWR